MTVNLARFISLLVLTLALGVLAVASLPPLDSKENMQSAWPPFSRDGGSFSVPPGFHCQDPFLPASGTFAPLWFLELPPPTTCVARLADRHSSLEIFLLSGPPEDLGPLLSRARSLHVAESRESGGNRQPILTADQTVLTVRKARVKRRGQKESWVLLAWGEKNGRLFVANVGAHAMDFDNSRLARVLGSLRLPG